MIFKKAVLCGVVAAPTPLFRGGTDYFIKKHHLILGVLLAARCVFLQDALGALLGVSVQICSNESGIHELKMSENVSHGHCMRPNRLSFTFMHSYAVS